MVRCDWVDAIDRDLRHLMQNRLPFGGKQMIFVGDLFQLPPVVKRGSADEELLCKLYGNGTHYFYKANVVKRINLPMIEFLKVYRQNDTEFLEILDRMRVGENTDADLSTLNSHVSSNDAVGNYAVTLTAYNNVADNINNMKLADIDAEEYCYEGEIDGDFRMSDSPVPMQLRLKEGAQVIICRNDFSQECVNGTIAIVSKLDEDGIQVRLKNGKQIAMKKMIWASYESVYNEETGKVESEEVGTFTQYPLKLAWAITIHKSQGMTFDRMHLDLTRGTFAPGHTYVAVSRMRTLEGLTVSNKLQRHHIIQNAEIKAYSNSFNNMAVIDEELLFGQMLYKCYQANDYDGAVKVCMHRSLEMMKVGDYRNAALMAKKMYDVMLDDKCLMGMTDGNKIIFRNVLRLAYLVKYTVFKVCQLQKRISSIDILKEEMREMIFMSMIFVFIEQRHLPDELHMLICKLFSDTVIIIPQMLYIRINIDSVGSVKLTVAL